MERSAVWARLSEELGEGSESLSAVQGSSICGMGQPIWGMGLRVGLATCGVRLAILRGGSGLIKFERPEELSILALLPCMIFKYLVYVLKALVDRAD